MKVLLDFEGIPGFGAVASELLALSRGLARLERLLNAPRASGFVVVTRPEPLPVLETKRLVDWLRDHGIARRALFVNGFTPAGGCRRCRRAAIRERREAARLAGTASDASAVVEADVVAPSPRGARALEAWTRTWRLSNLPGVR
jgi:anion-transporting  ArsA/GET3 family ATPase